MMTNQRLVTLREMTRRIQEGDFQDTDNILCFDLCGTGCIYFVKGFALHIYLHVFYFNKKKSKGKEGRKRNKDGNGRGGKVRERKKGRLTISYGQ